MKIKNFFKKCWTNFKLIFRLSLNDLKKRYSGSIGGILWAYVQPLVVILVFWFVFEKGFRNSPVDGYPFILWMVPAYIAWTFINDSTSQSSNVMFEYSFLVKKIKFKIEFLPIVKVLSSFLIHLFFIVFAVVINLIYGYPFNPMWFQVFYYSFGLSVFLIGISWIVSSLSVFYKDVGQIVNVLLQIGFWLCPIFWNPDTMNPTIVKVLKFNPLFYVIQGYRETFMYGKPAFDYTLQTVYFWGVTVIIFVIGLLLFKKLKKHFADLL